MYELKVVTSFAAAHQLKMVTEKCENLHGHNWKVELCVAGDKLLESGVVIDFGIVKKYLAEIIDSLDHKFLNELPPFVDGNPSSENIANFITTAFGKKIGEHGLHGIRVSRVIVWESDDACATYIPDQA